MKGYVGHPSMKQDPVHTKMTAHEKECQRQADKGRLYGKWRNSIAAILFNYLFR